MLRPRKSGGRRAAHGKAAQVQAGSGIDMPLVRGIIESATTPIFCLDRALRYVAFNSAHARGVADISGVTIAVGSDFLDHLQSDEERDIARANMGRALAGEAFTLEVVVQDAQSGRHLFEADHRPVRGGDGGVAGIAVFWTDITARRHAEEEVRLAEKVFDNSRQAIMVTDTNAVILRVNPAFERITGYPRQEILGRNSGILSSGRQGKRFYEELWHSLGEAGMWEGELWNRRKSGELYPEYLSISAVRDAQGKVTNYVGLFQDISERKSAEERIQHLAHHDALTGLPNRELLRDRTGIALYHAKRQGKHLALLFINLDRFKGINDSFGHETGDAVLKHAGQTIVSCLRAGDSVCRLGGDEFMVLLPDVGEAADAGRLAEKLIAALSAPFEIEGRELRITGSAGIAIFPENGNDMETLQRNADAALHVAKDAGRNAVQFYSAVMNAQALEHLTMERDLRRALEKEELFLCYQPQVDLANGSVVGLEALIRWNHPEQGEVGPGAFIRIAEESGLIVPIGSWVLRRACLDMRNLIDRGIGNVQVAVNVSAPQFSKPDFVQQVRDALEEAGIPAALLELEVTESVIMRGPRPVIETLRELDEMGVSLSIDDFGTGYSSLSYLRQFPVKKLKIDQSFIRDIPAQADDMAIAEAIITLARALKLKVIAEGVETRAQAEFLREHRCDQAQGYYYGRPVPLDEIAQLIRNWQAPAP